jgi:hypothetical protein
VERGESRCLEELGYEALARDEDPWIWDAGGVLQHVFCSKIATPCLTVTFAEVSCRLQDLILAEGAQYSSEAREVVKLKRKASV